MEGPTVVVERRAPRSRADAAMVEDEARRTHAFMVVSGALAVVGWLATWFFDGHPALRMLFGAGVLWLVAGYLALWWHTRNLRNYSPAKAVASITLTNLTGVFASAYYGFFSPAPMILMLPIAYIGRSASGRGALIALSVAAGSMAVPMLAIALGLLDDPGLVTASELSASSKLLYTALIQSVFLACFLNARASRRATLAAVEGLARAERQVRRQQAQLEEAKEQLVAGREAGRGGPLTGHRLRTWVLGELLGRGAMGDVYAALRPVDELEAALKVLNPVAASDPRAVALMQREAELLQGIASPHVVRLLEVVVDDLPWIAMERLHGQDLATILQQADTLPVADVVRLVHEVAAGLDAAASAKVLHRDLKPSNIFRATIGPRSVWKILDFGVAKQLGQDLTLTSGQVLGTPGYIPPEMLAGDEVDHRGDVFSLAAVAYRTLTGARPFRGRGHALLISSLEDQPDRPSLFPGVPVEVDPVLAIGLAKSPGDRFDSAPALAQALAEAVRGDVSLELRRQAERILARRPWGSRGR